MSGLRENASFGYNLRGLNIPIRRPKFMSHSPEPFHNKTLALFLTAFINKAGRLRSGWRHLFFVAAFVALYVAIAGLLGDRYRLVMLGVATVLGWLCGWLFEGLPARALGWTLHRGWLRDLLLGSIFGVASLLLATGIAMLFGGFRFAASPLNLTMLTAMLKAAMLFVSAAAAEEAVFRGYQLQTVMRSWPFLVALLPSSAFFALVHLANPNANAPALIFVNTSLAGVWLAVAYYRTRSLWLALGLHWAWNWATGALLGLPVSGVIRHSGSSPLRATDVGPAWLTGGAYGIEGGAACTVALILSTIFIWRTRLFKPCAELKQFTDGENPAPEKSKPQEINM
ncbi:hypothetical protein BH18ACI2_BH18ACI2_23880 [soil metagenome]